MTDLAAAEREWQSWIQQACDAVGVDAGLVDVAGVHELTRDIAHGFSRPMAPVGAFIWGIALGQATANAAAGPSDASAAPEPGTDDQGAPDPRAADVRPADVRPADVRPADLRAAIAATAEAAAASTPD